MYAILHLYIIYEYLDCVYVRKYMRVHKWPREIVKGPNGFSSVRTLDVFRRDTVCGPNYGMCEYEYSYICTNWTWKTDRFAMLVYKSIAC